MAALNSHLGVAETLIRHGANVTALTYLNRTALHQAAQSGSLSVTQMLVRAGLPVTCRDKEDLTPLDLATRNGRSEVADWLRKQSSGEFGGAVGGKVLVEHIVCMGMIVYAYRWKINHTLLYKLLDISEAFIKIACVSDQVQGQLQRPRLADHELGGG